MLLELFIKKLDSKNFKPKRTAAKFSANIISATVYLFAGSPCSWVVEGADPYSPWLGSASKSNTLKVRANQAKLPTNIIFPPKTPKRRPDTIKSDRRSAIKILKYLKLSRPGIKKDPGRFNSPDAKFSKFVRSSKCFRIFQTPDHSAFHEMIE